MAKEIYKQCQLKTGNILDVVWIPIIYAKNGKHIRLNNDTRIWIVDKFFNTTLTREELMARSRDHLKQREASDI